jgi:hypothetical protein
MAVDINITNRERIFINPQNGQRIPKIEKGIINPGDVEQFEEEPAGDRTALEEENK